MKGRMVRLLLPPLLFGVLPVTLERALVWWLHDTGAAGVMLGAVSGASLESMATTMLALLLRIYAIVALPGLTVAWLVLRGRSSLVH